MRRDSKGAEEARWLKTEEEKECSLVKEILAGASKASG